MPENTQTNEYGDDAYDCAAEAFDQQAQEEVQQVPPPSQEEPSESEKNEYWLNK